MHIAIMRNLVLPCLVLAGSLCSQPSWQFMTGPIGSGFTNPILLTDGSVIAQEVNGGETGVWFRLKPDAKGSYLNGTWSQIATMPSDYKPLAFQSAVLPDGRVVAVGGEFNDADRNDLFTSKGAIYDPVANTWTAIPRPPPVNIFGSPANQIGDAPAVVTPAGDFVIARLNSKQILKLNAQTLTWTEFPGTGDLNPFGGDENGWTLLPDGTVLTVVPRGDVADPTAVDRSQTLDLNTMTWTPTRGTPPSPLTDLASREIGPQVLMPDGNVAVFGGSDFTSFSAPGYIGIYHPSTGTWTAGPQYPPGVGGNPILDNPAVLLPNGKVLVLFFTRLHPAYLFDGTNLTFTETVQPFAKEIFELTVDERLDNMLLLPSGQVLVTAANGIFSNIIGIYTPDGAPQPAWAPVITSAPTHVTPGQSYKITGTQFNGLSQAVAYGDDYAAATNYPLARLVNLATGDVIYCRTHDHSTMAVATGSLPVSTMVDIPSSIPPGPYNLYIVANGIPSAGWLIIVPDFSLDIKILNANPHTFHAEGSFTLGVGTTPINPVTDAVKFTFGSLTISIPPGSFKEPGNSDHFIFDGTINGFHLHVDIKAEHHGSSDYTFIIDGNGLDLTGQAEPLNVGLQIGINAGFTTFNAHVDH